MQLTIHRGTNQIGGNCVEISTNTTRIILDVGLPLSDLADSTAVHEEINAIELPQVPGLFAPGPTLDAVVLSHAHGDHSGLLPRVLSEIPIYMTKGTSQMLVAGNLFANGPRIPRDQTRTLEPYVPVKIGDITVTGLSVDHSAFDALAVLLEADGKRILYSGDLRMHGRKPGMAQRLIAHLQDKPIDLLLMEGTRLSRTDDDPQVTEEELVQKLIVEIKGTEGPVLANFSPQHVDRLISLYKATRSSGREWVMDAYAAFVWHLIQNSIKIPKLGTKGIHVYFNQAFEKSCRSKIPKVTSAVNKNRISLETLLRNPKRYVMLFRPGMIDLDFGGRFPDRSKWIYSYWPGYLAKNEYKDAKEKLKLTGGTFVECHTSGHISTQDLVQLLNKISPKKVIPIHTKNPENFMNLFENASLLRDGKPHAV